MDKEKVAGDILKELAEVQKIEENDANNENKFSTGFGFGTLFCC